MKRQDVNAICAGQPGAELSDPFGDGDHDCWKVGGKIFAICGADGRGVSLKTPSVEDAALLIEMGRALKAPYFHRSWVLIPFGTIGLDELRDRIDTSYDEITSRLPRRTRLGLGLPE